MKHNPDHSQQIKALKKIEGQIRGIQRMVEDRRYCVDIIVQLEAVIGAIARVEDEILKRHLECCVKDAMRAKSKSAADEKIDEILSLTKKIRGRR